MFAILLVICVSSALLFHSTGLLFLPQRSIENKVPRVSEKDSPAEEQLTHSPQQLQPQMRHDYGLGHLKMYWTFDAFVILLLLVICVLSALLLFHSKAYIYCHKEMQKKEILFFFLLSFYLRIFVHLLQRRTQSWVDLLIYKEQRSRKHQQQE